MNTPLSWNQLSFIAVSLTTLSLWWYFFFRVYLLQCRARRLAKMGRGKEAILSLLSGIEISPRDARLWERTGSFCFREGNIERGIEALQNSAKLEPTGIERSLRYAQELCDVGEYERALALLDALLREGTRGSIRCVLMHCVIEFELLRFREVEDDCNWLLDRGNDVLDAYVYNLRGIARLMLNRNEEALADFETSYLVEPQISETQLYCAVAWYRRGFWKKTVKLCDIILNKDPNNMAAAYYSRLANEKIQSCQ